MKEGKIYGVSLGPGDPDLITVKGLRILKEADKIYYVGSLLPSGERKSYSLGILEKYPLDATKMHGIFLTMSDNRSQAKESYRQAFLNIQEDYRQGKNVALVSEGDITFYSTFAYLLEYFQDHQLNVEMVSGVSSFLMAAGQQKIPLAILEEKIAILPRSKDVNELENYIKQFDTIILIKVRSVIKEIISVISKHHLKMVYAERLGTTQQYLTTHPNDLEGREIPYFSLIIIKRK